MARLKSCDPRFNFYPTFAVERSLALDFRAEKIQFLRIDIQVHREGIKTLYNVTDPCYLPQNNKHRKKFEKLTSNLAEHVEKYSMSNFHY